MSAITATALPSNKGPNNLYPALAEVDVGTALVNADTLVVTAPAGYDAGAVPQLIGVGTWNTTTGVYTALTTLALTSHNASTGVTTFTASGAVAQHAKVYILYVPQDVF